jgi:hypothetical protein
MAVFNRAASVMLFTAGIVLAGCSGENTGGIFTGSLANNTEAAAPQPKIDPVCVSLVSRIDALRKEGIGDKIEKAAAKRYRMTIADLGKADQLTKANAEFQLRCSTLTPGDNTAQTPPAGTSAPAAKKVSSVKASVVEAPN